MRIMYCICVSCLLLVYKRTHQPWRFVGTFIHYFEKVNVGREIDDWVSSELNSLQLWLLLTRARIKLQTSSTIIRVRQNDNYAKCGSRKFPRHGEIIGADPDIFPGGRIKHFFLLGKRSFKTCHENTISSVKKSAHLYCFYLFSEIT